MEPQSVDGNVSGLAFFLSDSTEGAATPSTHPGGSGLAEFWSLASCGPLVGRGHRPGHGLRAASSR